MQFTDYFDHVNENILTILESHFVSRIPSTEFIFLEKTVKKHKNMLDKFVLERSKSITQTNMKSSKGYLHPPQILWQNNQFNRARSVPNQSAKYKTEHSLMYFDFISAMMQVLRIPFKVSTNFFSQICRPSGNKNNANYNQIVDLTNNFFQLDQATALFVGCQIYWVDLLNYLSSKTTFVQPISEVKLIQKKVPKTFSHRLQINNLLFLEELGCYFTSSRDGLAQFWASEKPSKRVKFQLLDQMDFGLPDSELHYLAHKYHNLLDDPDKRSTKIDVIQKILHGEVSLEEIKMQKQDSEFITTIPYTVVQTLTNPEQDKSMMHIMMDSGQQQGGVSTIIRACRAADAPLPSGRPLPERVNRNINFNGGVYLCDFFSDDEDCQQKPQRNIQKRVQFNRSQSCKVNKQVEKSLEQLYEEGFQKISKQNTNNFFGNQHPVFNLEKKDFRGFKRSLNGDTNKQQTFKEEPVKKFKDFTACQQANGWATHAVIQNNQIYISAINCKILIYDITKKGIELKTVVKINGVGVTQLLVWNRQLNSTDIQKEQLQIDQQIQNLKQSNNYSSYLEQQLTNKKNSCVIGCLPSELPQPGEKCKIQNCLVYVTPTKIGILNTQTKKEFITIELNDLVKQNFEDDYYYENSQDDNDENNGFSNETTLVSAIAVDEKLFISTSNGCIIKLSAVTFKVDFIKRIFFSEISYFEWNQELKTLFVGGLNSQIKIYQYDIKFQLLQSMRDSGCVIGIFVSVKYDVFITVCANGVITAWNLKQYNQLVKQFVNETVTAACWDETSGVLVVGNVGMKVFKLLGAKTESNKKSNQLSHSKDIVQQKQLPQAHFMSVVSIVALEQQKVCREEIIEHDQDQFEKERLTVAQIQGKSENTTQLTQENQQKSENTTQFVEQVVVPVKKQNKNEPTGPPPHYKRRQFKREVNDFSLTMTRMPYQPEYEPPEPGKAPYVNYQFQEPLSNVSSMNYSRQSRRMNLVQQLQQKQYIMLDFTAYIERVEFESGKTRSFDKKKRTSKTTTGIDVLQTALTGETQAVSDYTSIKGYITIDEDGNLRHWGLDNKIIATYKIDIDEKEKIVSAVYDHNGNSLIVSLQSGKCYIFELLTYQITEHLNVSTCAKAAYLLQYNGMTYNKNQNYTEEFKAFLSTYNQKNYQSISISTVYQQSMAFACGNYILLFDKNGAKLSQRFVELLLAQNSKEAQQLSAGITRPPSMVLYGHSQNIISMDACGRKLITADEGGVVCCWMGQGIAKQVFQIQDDQVKQIFAVQNDQFWCLYLLKNGQFGIINKQLELLNLFQIKYNGVSEMHCSIYQTKSNIKLIISDVGKLLLLEIDLTNNLQLRIIGYFQLQCNCRYITSVNFTNNGNSICISDNGGHCFYLEDIEHIKSRNYFIKNKLVTKKEDETIQLQDDQLQYLYEFNQEDQIFTINTDFDPRFDNPSLIQLHAMSTNSMDDEFGNVADYVKDETKQFLESLKYVEDVQDNNQVEELDIRINNPTSVALSRNYISKEIERIYDLEKRLRLKLTAK